MTDRHVARTVRPSSTTMASVTRREVPTPSPSQKRPPPLPRKRKMRDKSRGEPHSQETPVVGDELSRRRILDRTGQTWIVVRGVGQTPAMALVVRSRSVDVNFGDGVGDLTRHELLFLDGDRAGSFGHLYEGSNAWDSTFRGWHDRVAGTSYERVL